VRNKFKQVCDGKVIFLLYFQIEKNYSGSKLCCHIGYQSISILCRLPLADLITLLKLINNSSSLNKGNHDRDTFWISDLNKNFYNFISLFSLKKVFDHISKHLKVCQKYSDARRIFSLENVANTDFVSKFVNNTPLRVVFSTLFLMFANGIKHSPSCLIYTGIWSSQFLKP